MEKTVPALAPKWKDVPEVPKLLVLVALAAAAGAPSALGPRATTARFVAAVNRADFRTACAMYSHRYLKASQAECRTLYRRGLELYGPYRYEVLSAHTLATHHYRVSINRRGKSAGYLEFASESAGWKLVHGGW
jgi:hypothetical protein